MPASFWNQSQETAIKRWREPRSVSDPGLMRCSFGTPLLCFFSLHRTHTRCMNIFKSWSYIRKKNQSSIKHTDRQAVKMDSCQDVTNNKKTYHTSAHSIDHRVKHSQLAIGNCSASHNVADYQCILGVQHFYYLQSKSLILTSCKHHPKPHQQTRACFSHVWLWVVCVFHFIFKMIYLSLSWGEILQHLAFWEVQKGNRCHSEWRDVFAGLPPYVEDHTAAVLQLIQPCEALYRIAVFTWPNATKNGHSKSHQAMATNHLKSRCSRGHRAHWWHLWPK